MELKEPLSGGEGDEGVTKAKAKGAMAMAMEMEMATMLQSSLRTRTVSTEYVYSVEYFLGNSPHQTRDLYKFNNNSSFFIPHIFHIIVSILGSP
ncbi:hypothetical protein PX690_21420 [Bacillus velezensis]|uniref:hypothetical protein n=1 Tax=Bacillus velezensis TaxID=492670 RepID=UPI0023E2A62B|nr:hypothetical protein [Bacillus velezensis]WES02033.1 hypothetical protein PX690_21420 [Bacillus velezensis]